MAIEDAILRRTELLKERLLSINPQAHITAIFGFMLAGWLSEIYYRPAVIVPYYLTGYEHAVVAACLVIAMHENVILAVKGYHSAMSYTDVTVIALGYYSAASGAQVCPFYPGTAFTAHSGIGLRTCLSGRQFFMSSDDITLMPMPVENI